MNPEASGLPTNAAIDSSNTWTRTRWWTLVLLVFAAQIGLILVFGDRQSVKPGLASPVTVINLAQSENELLALDDPTLFALPNLHGVAGQAWLKTPVIAFSPFRWTEAPRLLPLQPDQLGHAFGRFMQTNSFSRLVFETKPAPTVFLPASLQLAESPATNSTLRITGELAGRRWLNPPALRSWSGTDLLTNTVVQALVNPDGQVFSATLLVPVASGTNDQNAADYALQIVRGARFAPARSAARLTLGTLIFEWHTEPPSTTPTTP
jgi:hypothetical protein